MATERETITLFLDEYLDDYLGEQHCLPMRASIAQIVEGKVKGKLTYHIEWRLDSELPMLWRYKYWADSVERYERAKERSEKERIERFIFESNIRLITRQLMKLYFMDEPFAKGAAFSILRKNRKTMWNKLRAIGITKLAEKESDL